jgi:PAS domain S-box-containing protein
MLSNYELKQKLSYIILGQRGGQSRVKIIESLVERPYNINQLAEKLDLNYRPVRHHIEMLLKHGMIGTSHTGGYGEVYFVSPELEARLPLFREIATKLETISTSPRLFQSVMEQTNDAVAMLDEKLDVIFWNRSAEALFGHTSEAVMGSRIPVFPDTQALRRALAFVTEGKKVAGLEMQARTAGGKALDLELTIDCIRTEENRLVGYSMICQDITERKAALEALLVSQQRYALAQQAAHILSWEWDLASDAMRWSERPGPFLGLGPVADLGTFKAFLGHVYPEDRPLVAATAESIRKRGRDISIEHRITRPDGQLRWVRHTGGVVRDDKGKAQKLVGIIQDITERRDAERRYERVIGTSLDGFWMTDMKGRFLEANDSYCRLLGLSRRQLLRMSIKDVEAAEKPSETLRHIQRVMREGADRFETRHRRKDGTLVDLDVSATFLDSEGGRLVVFLRDITERKRAETELRLSEQRYALAQKAASIGSWEWDIASGALKWSDTIEPMFGFSPGKFKGTYAAFVKCVHPDDRARLESAVKASVDRKRPYDIEHRIVWPDGSVHWLSERGEVLRDARGRPVRMLGVVQDITDRKTNEERIRHLASFPQLDPNPVMELDLEGNVTYSNPVTAGILDGAGLKAASELRPTDFRMVLDELRKRPGSTVYRDVRLGTRVFRMGASRPPGLDRYRLYGVEITDRIRAEESLEQARSELARKDRMEALGRLAGATGQELSVPLTAIKNAVYYLGMVAGQAGPEVTEALDVLRREVAASEALLRNLGDIAHARPPETGPVDIGDLLDRTLSGMRIPEGIAVERIPGDGLPAITADAAQLGVVLRNLVQNAIEAMPGGGKLEVGAARGDSCIEVTVRDSGTGILEKDQGRLFNTFYTTKPRGIGLGLPVARQLVEGHGGRIKVESQPGKGSTFTVVLPVGGKGGTRP